MSNETLNAAANPALANDVIEKLIDEPEAKVEPAKIIPPSDTTVTLPGGRLLSSGEVVSTAEVRELTGRDEEAIAKSFSVGKALLTILSRGVVSVGSERATEEILDGLLAGDRDELALGIYKATFGPTAVIPSFCTSCEDWKDVEVDIDNHIPRKKLDKQEDRFFTVKGRKDEYLVTLPNGVFQKEVALSEDKSTAELSTSLLEQTVLQINGAPSLGRYQVQNLGVADRRSIAQAIAERNVGPQFADLTITCPDCGGEVAVPINLGTLFQL